MERRTSTIPAKAATSVGFEIKGKKTSHRIEKKASKAEYVSPTKPRNALSIDQSKTKKSSVAKSSPVPRKQTLTRKTTIQESQENMVVKNPASEKPRKSKAFPPKIKLSVGEKEQINSRPPSCSLPPSQRRNGLAENPVCLRTSPNSPHLSPEFFKNQSQLSPNTRRKAFFAKDPKVQKDSKARRDALSNATDDFAKERMAVRVLWKKF